MSSRVDKELDLLCNSPFFEGLDPEHIKHFASLARTETFEPGDRIIVQGEPATSFYMLVEGKVELAFRKPGDEVPQNEEAAGAGRAGRTAKRRGAGRVLPPEWGGANLGVF